jgi:hypothetical protein
VKDEVQSKAVEVPKNDEEKKEKIVKNEEEKEKVVEMGKNDIQTKLVEMAKSVESKVGTDLLIFVGRKV